jgi:hypothetical protein
MTQSKYYGDEVFRVGIVLELRFVLALNVPRFLTILWSILAQSGSAALDPLYNFIVNAQ